ncbi:MAG: AIR synthase-related protein [Propionibacteriaceae bacterium]|nr:AIR synthase-related protein [Propionibacteriaceae bacterium]
MNQIEKALMHALFLHPHHNTDKTIDFSKFTVLNEKVNQKNPGLIMVQPADNDDAGVFEIPGTGVRMVFKTESHCSPCVVEPYGSAVTCLTGCARDVVAMGGEPLVATDFIGTQPPENEVLVGPCGFVGDGKTCTCGNCNTMTNDRRVQLMLDGFRDGCEALGIGVVAGGFSTSFSDIVPALVGSIVGRLITDEPLKKPARNVGDKLILIGVTSNDGNDTAFRAGFADVMLPAQPLFEEEKTSMAGALAAFRTGKINACSDLGAAGIGAAVCESARYGGLGAKIDLSLVPLTAAAADNKPEATLINETQARYLLHVNPSDVEEVLAAIRATGSTATVIGEITDAAEVVFTYADDVVAVIPNSPSAAMFAELG